MGNGNTVTVYDFKVHVANPDGTFDAHYDRLRFNSEKKEFELSYGKENGTFSDAIAWPTVLIPDMGYGAADLNVDMDGDKTADYVMPIAVSDPKTGLPAAVVAVSAIFAPSTDGPILSAASNGLVGCANAFSQTIADEEANPRPVVHTGGRAMAQQTQQEKQNLATGVCIDEVLFGTLNSDSDGTRNGDTFEYKAEINNDGLPDSVRLMAGRDQLGFVVPDGGVAVINLAGKTVELPRTSRI